MNNRIVVNAIVDRIDGAILSVATRLMDYTNSIAKPGRNLYRISIYLYVAAILDEDLRSPKPNVMQIAVTSDTVVANDGVVGYLMFYAITAIKEYRVQVIENVEVVDIRP